jgi:hypothetical protein
MARTVEFLETTAKALPDQVVGYGSAAVCWCSLAGCFMYDQRYVGGALRRVTRDEVNALIQQPLR